MAKEEEGEGRGGNDDAIGSGGEADGLAIDGEGGDDGTGAKEVDKLGEEEEGEVGEEGGVDEGAGGGGEKEFREEGGNVIAAFGEAGRCEGVGLGGAVRQGKVVETK